MPFFFQADARRLPLAPESIDAIVTDPPYELGFMSKTWDASGVAYDRATWAEALRVAKPGAHLLAFGGTRTHHRLMVAIEDAGWEIRDVLMWLFGSGFPKSLNVGQGWGTALKPAYEPIVLARKPLIGTVAQNVTAYGTGALNIDGTRIGTDGGGTHCTNRDEKGDCLGHSGGSAWDTHHGSETDGGRWPANLILDEEAGALLDGMVGETVSPSNPVRQGGVEGFRPGDPGDSARDGFGVGYADRGGPSRFFYTAKAGRAEREAGLEEFAAKTRAEITGRAPGSAGLEGSDGNGNNPRSGANYSTRRRNDHPTVKPIDLMRYLCRLITPPGGTVLDPFCGSGSTGMAALDAGFDFIGTDLDPHYLAIAQQRAAYRHDFTAAPVVPTPTSDQGRLF